MQQIQPKYRNSRKLYKFQELANYRKRDTDLPVNIWVDESQTYKKGKHYKRIKFQLNKSNQVQKENFASISLIDCKVIDREKVLKQKNCEISEREFRKLENFVQNNQFALLQIEEGIISESEFLKVLVKGGDLQPLDVREELVLQTCNVIIDNIDKENYDSFELISAQKALLSVFSEKDILQNFGFKIDTL